MEKNACKNAESQRGAASVLIIFMMMILVTLGAFAITSANVNRKLSERSLEWNSVYYELDAKGEELIADIDTKLAEAEAAALTYIKEGKYAEPQVSEIAPETQAVIYENYADGSFDDSYLPESIRNIYMYYAKKLINTLADSNIQVYTIEEGGLVNYILLEAKIVPDTPGAAARDLNISVWVEPAEYTAAEQNGLIVLTRSETASRYTIEEWYEHQEPINEEDEIGEELWDGTL